MAFKEGVSGNPGGRPKGAKNITSSEVKELVLSVMQKDYSLNKISKDLKALKPQQRLNFFLRLAQLVIPKENALKIDYEKLSPEQLDFIFNKLTSEDDE
jgi:hypothetical protein